MTTIQRIQAIRAEIAAGNYETANKLACALNKALEDALGEPPPIRFVSGDPLVVVGQGDYRRTYPKPRKGGA